MSTNHKNVMEKPDHLSHERAMDLSQKVASGANEAIHSAEELVTAGKRKFADAVEKAEENAEALTEVAANAVRDGQSRIAGLVGKAQDTAVGAKDAIVAGAGTTLAAVRDVAIEKADAARETLSEVGDRLAATLNRASGEDENDVLKSRVLTSVAQGLTNVSDVLRQRSVAELGSDVKLMAKRHPGAFMVAAAVAGFAAARFVRSSSRRRADRLGQGPTV